MKTIIRIALSAMLLFAGFLYAQKTEKPYLIDQLSNQLNNYRLQAVNQEVYVTTDKTLYRPGENIWFKGYVTDVLTHQPSLKSLDLNVFIISDKGKELKYDRFKLQNGITDGDFMIPATAKEGNYYLVAYTPEMMNKPVNQVFFKRIIIQRPEAANLHYDMAFDKQVYQTGDQVTAKCILSDLNNNHPESNVKIRYTVQTGTKTFASGKVRTDKKGNALISFPVPSIKLTGPLMLDVHFTENKKDFHFNNNVPLSNAKLTVHFFPEGGKLLPATPQMVAFRVSDAFGDPVKANGNILDDNGKMVTTGGTIAPGLGLFSLMAQNDNNLRLVITSEPGKGQVFPLPKPSAEAVSISARQSNPDTLWMTLKRPAQSKQKIYSVIGINHGEVVWANEFKIGQGGRIPVNLNNFRQGVSLFSLFDKNGTLCGQRLVNINKGKIIRVTAKLPKSLSTEQNGNIQLALTDEKGNPVKAEIAVSIADNLTQTKETPGVISLNYGTAQPVTISNPELSKNATILNFYLVASQWRNFSWKKIRSYTDSTSIGQQPKLQVSVSGTVLDHRNQPVANAKVNIVNANMQMFATTSDSTGHFEMSSPLLSNPKNLTITATNRKGKKDLIVKVDRSFGDKVMDYIRTKPKSDPWKTEMSLIKTAYFQNNPKLFASVPNNIRKSATSPKKNDFWKVYLDQSSNLLDIIKMIKPFDLMGNKIVFRSGHNSMLFQGGALIVVDGQQLGTDATVLNSITPSSVEDINVSTNPMDIAKYTGMNSVGVIEITTKGGKITKETENKGPKYEKGLRVSRKFAPLPIGKPRFNLATTLMWAPNIFTNSKGQAMIHFKTSKLKSTYNVHIEGISIDGIWFQKNMQFEVN